MNYNLDK